VAAPRPRGRGALPRLAALAARASPRRRRRRSADDRRARSVAASRARCCSSGAGVAELFLLPIGWPACGGDRLASRAAAGRRAAAVSPGSRCSRLVGAAIDAPRRSRRAGSARSAPRCAVVPLALWGDRAPRVRAAIAPSLALAVLGGGRSSIRGRLRSPDAARAARPPARHARVARRAGALGRPADARGVAAARLALVLAADASCPPDARWRSSGRRTHGASRSPAGRCGAAGGRARVSGASAAALADAASTAPESGVAVSRVRGVPFLAGRLPAGPHDYFYPGRPTRASRGAVERLRARRRRLRRHRATAPGGSPSVGRRYPELGRTCSRRYRVVLDRTPLTVARRWLRCAAR
jgi:hypothetical protein